MRILIISDNLYTYSGREKIANYMCDIMSQNRCSVDMLSMMGEGVPFYSYKGVDDFYSLTSKKFKFFKILSLIKKNNYDFVFVLTMGRLSISLSLLNLFLLGQTKIVSCEHVSFLSLPFYVRLLKLITSRLYHSIIVLTQRDKSVYFKVNNNSVVIHNPIFFREGRTPFDKRSKTAIAVGRLNKQKNFSELIKIWRMARPLGWKLVILGDGPEYHQLNELIISYEMSDEVILKGRVKNVEDYYRKAGLLLMTSIYEGFPLAITEAREWGLPVIAYDCNTGPRELINDGKDGYLIPEGDRAQFVSKIKKICGDESILEEMSYESCNSFGHYNEENIKNNWVKFLAGDFFNDT